MIRLRSPHAPARRPSRIPHPSYTAAAVGRPPVGPGNYVRTWAGYSVKVSVVWHEGVLVEIAPSGFTSRITELPDAVWTPVPNSP